MVALGLARFSYALVLPSMREDLSLSFARSGGLGTANTLGYLVGVASLPWLLARIAPRRALLFGCIGVSATLFATAASSLYPWLVFARFCSGLGGASANLVGLSLAATLVAHHRLALVVFNAGVGISIMITGAILPTLLTSHADNWRIAWIVLGLLGVVATVACSLANVGQRGHLTRVGPSAREASVNSDASLPSLRWLTWSYVCFGSGYIVYITFLVATLRRRQLSTSLSSFAFVLVGAACLCGAALWGRVHQRFDETSIMAISLATISSAGVLLLVDRTPALLVSVVIFGVSFMTVPTFVTATIRSLRSEALWPMTISRVTMPFAVSQAIAPWLAGAGVDQFGTSFAPLWTAFFCTSGAVFAIAQRRTMTALRILSE